jgi:dihydroorotate dehydrogenase (NAD+) catalytic subunit
LGESADSLAPFQEVAAGVVTRTMRLNVPESRRVFPSPHLSLGPRRHWLINCEWGNLRSIEYWERDGLPQATERGPVIVSVSGRNIDDCVESCARLHGLARMFEINVSCSHAGLKYGHITNDLDHIRRLTSAVKNTVDTPIIIKLGWDPALAEVARVAAEAGADAIAVTNSVGPGLDLDLPSGRPKLGISGGFGGLSGPAIFPLALECVREVVEAVNIPVVGIGGIKSYTDVLKMLMVGATCVELYTAALLNGPQIFSRINSGLMHYLSRYGYDSIAAIRGQSLEYLRSESNLIPLIPTINPGRCTPCGACVRICPQDAIALDLTAVIDPELCTGCGICIDACPPVYKAISIAPE